MLSSRQQKKEIYISFLKCKRKTFPLTFNSKLIIKCCNFQSRFQHLYRNAILKKVLFSFNKKKYTARRKMGLNILQNSILI